MPIIISKNGKDAEKVEQSSFGLEDNLQQYIYNNPDSIPLYDIDKDTRLFIAAREFATKSGPIDALGFDSSGNIYVVETKLYKNPDKRTVVAQALDYGASLWRHATSFDDFIIELNKHTEKQFNMSFLDKYSEFFELEDAAENIQNIRMNLGEGSIKFVVLMDKLHEALKDLVIFVNQNSKFDLYAVEFEYYKHAEFEIVIPKLFGAEVKKDVATTANKSQWQWLNETEADFMDRTNKARKEDSAISVDDIIRFISLAKEAAIKVGGQVQYGHVVSKTRDIGKLILNNSSGRAVFYLDSDSSLGFYMYDASSNFNTINRSISDQIIDRNLFGRGSASHERSQIIMKLRGAKNSDIEALADIFRLEINTTKSDRNRIDET